jgi:hypothetical protein
VGRVYSERFCDAPNITGGPFSAYTVPAGFVVVVKCLTIAWGDVTLSGLDAWFETSAGTKLRRITFAAGLTPVIGGSDVAYGNFVLPAGDQLYYQASAGTADFHASGYLLSLP